MNIKASLQTIQNFYLQILLGQTPTNGDNPVKGAANLEQSATGTDSSLSISFAFHSKTEITLQAKQIDNSLPGNGQQTENQETASTSPTDAFNNGPWGVDQTAARIANFVLSGAGDDPDRLRLGRDAIMKGFQDAEKVWGGKLPDISYQTIDKAVALIDQKLNSLGQPVVNTVV